VCKQLRNYGDDRQRKQKHQEECLEREEKKEQKIESKAELFKRRFGVTRSWQDRDCTHSNEAEKLLLAALTQHSLSDVKCKYIVVLCYSDTMTSSMHTDALREYGRLAGVRLCWAAVWCCGTLGCHVSLTTMQKLFIITLAILQLLMSYKNSLKLPLSAQDRPSQKPGGSPPPPPHFLQVSRLHIS